MTEDDVVEQKFYVRKVRALHGYADQWQVAYPGPLDKPTQSVRVPNWEEALFIAICGVHYLERHGWEQFRTKVLHLED